MATAAHHPDPVEYVRRVRIATAIATWSVAVLASGCTVGRGAVAGMGVDSDGNPVGYLQVCHDHIDGATIYIDDAHEFGSWESSPAATGFATWSMTDPSGTWTATDPLDRLRPRTTYVMYGWTSDNSSSAASVEFTIEELASMKPGQVRYWVGTTADLKSDVYTVTSEDEFRRNACKAIGG